MDFLTSPRFTQTLLQDAGVCRNPLCSFVPAQTPGLLLPKPQVCSCTNPRFALGDESVPGQALSDTNRMRNVVEMPGMNSNSTSQISRAAECQMAASGNNCQALRQQ